MCTTLCSALRGAMCGALVKKYFRLSIHKLWDGEYSDTETSSLVCSEIETVEQFGEVWVCATALCTTLCGTLCGRLCTTLCGALCGTLWGSLYGTLCSALWSTVWSTRKKCFIKTPKFSILQPQLAAAPSLVKKNWGNKTFPTQNLQQIKRAKDLARYK